MRLWSSMRGSHGLSALRAQRTKSRGPKGLQPEVGARRAPRTILQKKFAKGREVGVTPLWIDSEVGNLQGFSCGQKGAGLFTRTSENYIDFINTCKRQQKLENVLLSSCVNFLCQFLQTFPASKHNMAQCQSTISRQGSENSINFLLESHQLPLTILHRVIFSPKS